MKLFGLKAMSDCDGKPITISSKQLFSNEEKANNYISEFTKLCLDYLAEEKDLQITITDYELQE